jgi:hypothetical protein
MIPFKETTSNRRLKVYTDKKKKIHAGESEESSDESDGMTFAEFVQKMAEKERNREMLKQEVDADMYIEKINFMKQYRDDKTAFEQTGYRPCTSEDLTANQKVKVRVKAAGLDFP